MLRKRGRYEEKRINDTDAGQIVPELPKDWKRWVLRNAVTKHYIFYKYKKGSAREGYCTHCGRTVAIQKPKYNQPGVCSRCGHKIIFKSVDKAPSFWTDEETAYLIQRCDKASAFLRKWQKVVQKRLTGDDFELAKKSREIRIESYAEMRKKKVKINGGLFRGQYLADVLEADLMEIPDTVKEAA